MEQTDYSTAATGSFLGEEPEVKDVEYKSVEEAAKALNLTIINPVQDRRSSNKFLGSENEPLSKLNYHGKPRR